MTQAETETISIVIADDHAVMRSGLKLLLDAEPDLEVVAEAADVDETIRKLKAYKPAILLLDLHMPGGPSLQFIPAMREAAPETKIVVLTMQNSAGFVREALKNGAIGYVVKEEADAQLIQAVQQGEVSTALFTLGSRSRGAAADRAWTYQQRDRLAAVPERPDRRVTPGAHPAEAPCRNARRARPLRARASARRAAWRIVRIRRRSQY